MMPGTGGKHRPVAAIAAAGAVSRSGRPLRTPRTCMGSHRRVCSLPGPVIPHARATLARGGGVRQMEGGGWPHLHRRPALLASTHPLHLAPASPRGPAKPRASPYTYAAISRRITQAALSRRRRGDGPPNRRRHPPRGAPSYAMRHGAATALQTAGATPPPQPCPPFRAGRSRSLCGANAIRSHYAAEHGGGRIRRRQPWTADRRRRSGRTAAGMSRQGARALADRRRTATPAWCMGRAYARAASAPRLRRSPRCAPASGPQPWPPGRRQNAKSANVKK